MRFELLLFFPLMRLPDFFLLATFGCGMR
jgi:hypothetical protein